MATTQDRCFCVCSICTSDKSQRRRKMNSHRSMLIKQRVVFFGIEIIDIFPSNRAFIYLLSKSKKKKWFSKNKSF